MTSFLALPNELLQHVAGCLPCSSLFRLIQVNRRLYEVCNDRYVYQLIAKNTLSHNSRASRRLHNISFSIDRSSLSSNQLAWPEGDLLLQIASLATTIRVAYAVEKCISALCRKDDGWTLKLGKGTTLYDVSDWLPHMLALHHPSGWCLEPDSFLRLQGALRIFVPDLTRPSLISRVLPWSRVAMEDESIGVKQKTAEFINANFILSYVTIQRMKTTRSPKDVIRLFEDFFFPVWLEGTHPNSWGGEQKIISKTIEKLCNRVPKYGQFVNEFTLVQAMAVLPAMIVELAAQCNPDQLGYMPIPAHIPFSTFMDIPAVFHRTAENFSTCHVREMTTHTFLSGHWQGYYSDQRPFLNARRFHIPMRDIRIVARAASGEGSTRMKTKAIIDRRSRGVDSHGEFSLDGRVCEDGLVHLSKKYIGMGQPWPWSGRMTPFGIIGVWGDSNNFGGYFWISKHEWC